MTISHTELLRAFPVGILLDLWRGGDAALPYPLRAVPMGIRLVYFVDAVSLSPSML
jgi:hypothetical protein